jgi:8-oxo-dGTP pyrophosphatase MutT (NUDIX family)
MKKATLVFLIKKESGKVSEICLAMKKRGFGMGRWNGAGGKVEEGESYEEAAIRETNEEIGVKVNKIEPIAELTFIFANKEEWNQSVRAYFSDQWVGQPEESEEMSPQWFKANDLPFSEMWPDDKFWLPDVIKGKKLKASFTFGENDSVLDKKIETVNIL